VAGGELGGGAGLAAGAVLGILGVEDSRGGFGSVDEGQEVAQVGDRSARFTQHLMTAGGEVGEQLVEVAGDPPRRRHSGQRP